MSESSNRRLFLRETLLVATGACAGILLPGQLRRGLESPVRADEASSGGNFEKRLAELGIVLPEPAKPVAVYVPAVITGNLLFTSGHIGWSDDGKPLQGRVGTDLTLEQGADAARRTGLSILTTVRQTLGSLDKVVRLVKVLGMVNSSPDFTQHPKVINGFSELMVQIFGADAGKGARSAVGMGALPFNTPVEIEAVFEVVAGK